ncbi:MAG TPA: hypothetical protein VID07_09610 [Actinomycetes bacterium]
MDAIRLVPPPGLVDAATALPRPARTGGPAARLAAVLAAGAAGAYTWALEGPEAGHRVWGELAALGLTLLEARFQDPGPDSARFTLGSQVSTLAQWAWLAGDTPAGRRADRLACELAVGGWPGRLRLDRPDLVLLSDPTGQKALDHAGSRVRLGSIRDFPVAGPEDGGSWRRPGTVDRLLDNVSRQAHLAGPLVGATARLLRTLVHPAMGPPWPPAAATDAQRRLAAMAMGDTDAWAFALPWLLDTAARFPARLAPLRPG